MINVQETIELTEAKLGRKLTDKEKEIVEVLGSLLNAAYKDD